MVLLFITQHVLVSAEFVFFVFVCLFAEFIGFILLGIDLSASSPFSATYNNSRPQTPLWIVTILLFILGSQLGVVCSTALQHYNKMRLVLVEWTRSQIMLRASFIEHMHAEHDCEIKNYRAQVHIAICNLNHCEAAKHAWEFHFKMIQKYKHEKIRDCLAQVLSNGLKIASMPKNRMPQAALASVVLGIYAFLVILPLICWTTLGWAFGTIVATATAIIFLGYYLSWKCLQARDLLHESDSIFTNSDWGRITSGMKLTDYNSRE